LKLRFELRRRIRFGEQEHDELDIAEELRKRAVDEKRERPEGLCPRIVRLPRCLAVPKALLCPRPELVPPLFDNGLDERLLGIEIRIDAADGDSDFLGDLAHGHIDIPAGKKTLRRLQNERALLCGLHPSHTADPSS